jgi:hypothetical protein
MAMFNNKDGFKSTDFNWFTGVVEDRHDPLVLNRVKVRCFGWHTENKRALPTEELPWASVLMPTTSSGTSGVGEGTHGLVEGSWVMGFFRDGNDAQDPVIMGTIMGTNTEGAEPTTGFNDPYGVFPREAGTDAGTRALGLDSERVRPVGATEPEDAYAPQYPYNKVRLTESGHIVEFDDTPGAERINIRHRTGSFIELRPDTSMRTRSKERFDAMTQWTVTVTGDATVNVGGSMSTTVQGNMTSSVAGNSYIDTKGNVTSRVSGSHYGYVQGSSILQTTGNINVKTTGNLTVDSAGKIDFRSDGPFSITAPSMTIDLQEDLSIVGTNMITDMSATIVTQVPTLSMITDVTRIDATQSLDLHTVALTAMGVATMELGTSAFDLNAVASAYINAGESIDISAGSEMNLVTATMQIDADAEMSLASPTMNLDADGTMNIAGGTTNLGSSGTTIIKSSFLDLNPGGTMSPGSAFSPDDAPEIPDIPLVPAPTSPNALPAVGFDALESAPFEVQIDEADTDISFPTPKYSAITPDGTAAYSQQVLNLTSTGRAGISGYSGTGLQSKTSDTTNPAIDGKIIYQDDAGTTVKYTNAHATRNKEIVSALEQIIITACKNSGLSAEIFSGGMTPQRRTGSDRHLNGFAADVHLFTSEGKRLNVQSQELRGWCQQAKNAGATAIGAGVGYMGNVGVHLDISAGNTVPAGAAKYWGAGGRAANAPSWLITIMTS